MQPSDRNTALVTGAATAVSAGGTSSSSASKSPAGGQSNGKAASGGAGSAQSPAGAVSASAGEAAAQERRFFRVVFKPRIAARSQPQPSSVVVASLSKGTIIEAAEIRDGWVRLADRELRRSRVAENTQGWVLIDGKSLGLGALLQPCDENGSVAVKLLVQEIAGQNCVVEAMTSWTVQQAKAAIEAKLAVPAHLQRLFVSGTELRKGMNISSAVACDSDAADQLEAGYLDLTLQRRTPDQASWSERFEAAGPLASEELKKAPVAVRNDLELVEEAVGYCGCALEYVGQELRANREVVLTAVRSDPAALRFADKALQADREVLRQTVEQSCTVLEQSAAATTGGPGRALEYAVGMLWTSYKRVTGYRTVRNEDKRIHRLRPLYLKHEDRSDQAPFVFVGGVSPGSKPWLGFGGSFTEAAAETLMKMPTDKQGQVVRAYFDKEVGHGYVLGRVTIGSCDFGLGFWSCGETSESDPELNAFSIDHYRVAILPMLKRASDTAGAQLQLLASPWSPPTWMKTSQVYNGDGHLKEKCREAWAHYFVCFIKSMAKAGVPIWGVTVQNEPLAGQQWESCIYTAQEECTFVRDYLGPQLAAAGLGSVKVLMWDHNRDGMLERACHAYCDPEVAKYVWGMAYHWYGDARFEAWPDRYPVPFEDRQQAATPVPEIRSRLCLENVRRVAELRPDKHILQTESCQELGNRSLKSCLNDWKLAERYAMNIIADLNSGCEGWIDWNLCLDQNGGPNHAGNNCVAPIICDTQTGEVLQQPCYWYIGHFSRFIKPGAHRAICASSRDVLEATSFLNPDGSLIVVVMNQSSDLVDFTLKVGEAGGVPCDAPPRSITTYVVDKA